MLHRLPLSHLVAVDKVISLYRSVVARQRHLEFQLNSARCTPLARAMTLPASLELHTLRQISRRLAVNSFISTARYKACRRRFLSFGTAAEQLDRLFGENRIRRSANPDPTEKLILDCARRRAAEARAAELVHRCKSEMAYRTAQGWYVVFDTKTVQPGREAEVFTSGAHSPFTEYARAVNRAVAAAVFGSYRRRDGSDYHSYFSVVEPGGKNGRLHIHTLHFCRALPAGCCDPNLGAERPVKREISALKSFWRFGLSFPIAARFGVADAYGLDGWRWPMVKREDGEYQPAPLGSPDALGGYLGKYIVKAYLDESRGVYKWRTRMSRSLGTATLRKTLQTLPTRTLHTLATQPLQTAPLVRGHRVPTNLIRRESTRQILIRFKMSKTRKSMRFLPMLRPRETIVERWRAVRLRLTTPTTSPPSMSTGVSTMRKLRSTDIFEFCAALERTYELDFCPVGGLVSAAGPVRGVV